MGYTYSNINHPSLSLVIGDGHNRMVSGKMALFDAADRLLLVKPIYKQGWILPGGKVEKGESPRQAAKREAKEELGILVEPNELLIVDVVQDGESDGQYLSFTFAGATIDDGQIGSIVLQKEELSEYRFATFEEAKMMAHPRLGRRLNILMRAREEKRCFYLENGKIDASY